MSASLQLEDWRSQLPAEVAARAPGATLPQTYEAAKNALERCAQIDEAKRWSDKAAALASYARQANDQSLRVMAQRIHLRAVVRIGELLLQIPPSKSRHQPGRFRAARAAGLSQRNAGKAMAIARVPRAERDNAIDADEPPSVRSLERRAPRSKHVPEHLFVVRSEFYRALSRESAGLFQFCAWLERFDLPPVDLTDEERKRVLRRINDTKRGLRKLRKLVQGDSE